MASISEDSVPINTVPERWQWPWALAHLKRGYYSSDNLRERLMVGSSPPYSPPYRPPYGPEDGTSELAHV